MDTTLEIPIVAIVGRPNVGKSTLFNRILGERRAIVEDEPGVTRDRNYALVSRYALPFHIVDTGGFEKDPEDELARHTVQQTLLAIDQADIILALFDGTVGLQAGDEDVVSLLRESSSREGDSRTVYFVVNKCDGKEQLQKLYDFYQLGVSELIGVSALTGYGIRGFVDRILQDLPDYEARTQEEHARRESRLAEEENLAVKLEAEYPIPDEELNEDFDDGAEQAEVFPERPVRFAPVFIPGEDEISPDEYDREFRLISEPMPRRYTFSDLEPPAPAEMLDQDELAQAKTEKSPVTLTELRVSLVGRPNVGKSTLLNRLVGERRAITSPVPGTTRDLIDATITHAGVQLTIVDTAGLRKQARITEAVERYSSLRSLRAITMCDVAVIVLDAVEGPTEQDAKIVGLAHEHGKAIVLAVNKWDAIKKDHRTVHELTDKIRHTLKFAPYAPMVFISALEGKRCPKLLETVQEVARERLRRIPTGKLNQVLQRAVRQTPPPAHRGIPVRFYFGAQIDVAPVTIVLFFNQIRHLHFSFLRFLKNTIRDSFELSGSDIRLIPRKRG